MNGVSIAIHDGKVIEIGSDISSESAAKLDAMGLVATAGLWNSHVHFTNPALRENAAEVITKTFLQYGFTSVLDTGSELLATKVISGLIDSGEIAGPNIYTANGSFVYKDGTPSYLPGIRLPEIEDPTAAEPMVASVLDAGANGIKIFSGSFISPTVTIYLPPEIIRAIADAVHSRNGFLVSHPTDRTGLVNAIENGVDILAHSAPAAGPLGKELIETMKQNNVALIPTLKLWSYDLGRFGAPEHFIKMAENSGVGQVAEYYSAGGEILFGTDSGYMHDFNPKDEFVLMQRAGMDFNSILTSMTVSPARRFTNESGKLKIGSNADIVVYAESPVENVANFAKIQYTIKDGKVVYCANKIQAAELCM